MGRILMIMVGTITFNSSKSSLYVKDVAFWIFRLNKKPVRRTKLVIPRKLIIVRIRLIAVGLKMVFCSKYRIPRFLVEKPPVEMAVIAWFSASKGFNPPKKSKERKPIPVTAR